MKKILVIDDEASLVKLLKRVLEKKGYSVTVCTDEYQGVALFKEQHYDLLVVDYNLRSVSAAQVIREIKDGNPLFPVLIMSGKTNDFLQKNSYENICFMLKPFSMTQFTDKVKTLLEDRSPTN